MAIDVGFPHDSVAFVNADGTLTRSGRRFLLDLWNRTGGAQGGISATVPLAKLTGGGANGSETFENGILKQTTSPT